VNKKGFVQKELKTALEVLDLFPESEYQNGSRKIFKVVIPGKLLLRNKL
jgi:hypothetical protein